MGKMLKLEDLLKGVNDIKLVHIEELGGDIEVHKIPSLVLTEIQRNAKAEAYKNTAERWNISPIELTKDQFRYAEVVAQADNEANIISSAMIIEEATKGTNFPISKEDIFRMQIDTVNILIEKVFTEIGLFVGDVSDLDKNDGSDIKN